MYVGSEGVTAGKNLRAKRAGKAALRAEDLLDAWCNDILPQIPECSVSGTMLTQVLARFEEQSRVPLHQLQ